MIEDPIVREVREIRHEIESECENDTEAFYEWLIASQQKLKGRVVRRQPRDMRRETRDCRVEVPSTSRVVRRQPRDMRRETRDCRVEVPSTSRLVSHV